MVLQRNGSLKSRILSIFVEKRAKVGGGKRAKVGNEEGREGKGGEKEG